MNSVKIIFPYIVLSLLGMFFFMTFTGDVHLFDWDEINFAESSREMLVTGNFFQVQIDFEPFQEKPPLFFWLQSLSMKLFGVSEFSARLPNAFTGVLSLLIVFKIGDSMKGNRFGWIWSLIYLGSLLPHLYYKSGIIDPVFNLFIFLGIYFVIFWVDSQDFKKRFKYSFFSGFFIGLAVITKGPVGLLLLILTVFVYWLINRTKKMFKFNEILIFILSFSFVSFFWFGYETIQNGPWFLIEFINYQIELFSQPVAGHEQPIYYHFVVVLIGCFPMSFIAFPRFLKSSESNVANFELWMKTLFWVVLILFTIVSTKIVHYSSMTYLPLSFLAALELNSYSKRFSSKFWMNFVLLFFGLIIAFVFFIIPYLALFHLEFIKLVIQDDFIKAALSVDVHWLGYEYVFGVIYFLALVLFVYFLNKKHIISSLVILTFGLGLTVLFFGKYVLPKIEMYTQGPAIDFYESLKNENNYITTVGFKSYAHYFYSEIKPLNVEDSLYIKRREFKKDAMLNHSVFNQVARKEVQSKILNWLKNGSVDRDVYFVSRTDRNHLLDRNKNIEFLYQKGGFVFYKRKLIKIEYYEY